jgi:nifR3 family TIM-barrel protein
VGKPVERNLLVPYRMEIEREDSIDRQALPALQDEFVPLRIGPLSIWPPAVLAPMAGVTNYPFRALCRRFGAGLCIGEMVAARPLAEARAKTIKLASFGVDETPRSLQLYGVDPYHVGEAVKKLVGENAVDHLDLNFGCSVPKVTRKGGGAAIPLKPKLLASIIRAAVSNAKTIPVTIKFRIGLDDAHITFLQSGQIAEQEGCAAVCLHARTAAQFYSGRARWQAIGELKQAVARIPVLGNGDIWEAQDALRMMRETGCDGVLVARGALGRPWLFRDIFDLFSGKPLQPPPNFGDVIDLMLEHARLLCAWLGEAPAMRAFRQHTCWYTKGFPNSASLRDQLMRVSTLDELQQTVAPIDRAQPYPDAALGARRGKSSGIQRVSLPEGYLDV